MKSVWLILFFVVAVSAQAQYGEGRYTFVFLNTNPDRAELPKEQVDSLQAGHMNNINRLVKEKKMIAAGPFYTGGGIFLFDTNQEETEAVLNSDPAIAAGRFKLEVYPFDLMQGKLCTLWHMDEADVEMTTYYFVRLMPNKDDENIDAVKTNRYTENVLKDLKRKYKDEAELIGAINLNTNEGQLVIYRSDQEGGIEDLFREHELVKKGLMTYYHKQIYFPKGVFCEN
ncbi:YciI family protein [Roseivirga sp.]|uniref:YciI family protein n=1 Tax=Roseivirga sp. TaxID=1964215 RepID=UPI003B5237F0